MADVESEFHIQLQSCVLRPWYEGHREALVLHANDREVWRNLRDLFPYPYTDSDAREWIAAAGHQAPWELCIEVDGTAAGGIGLRRGEDVFHRSAEIGYWLGRAVWGRGIATEAVHGMTRLGFERLALLRIWAGVFAWNVASGRVLEKAGYRLEGCQRSAAVKDGEIVDQLLYARIRRDEQL